MCVAMFTVMMVVAAGLAGLERSGGSDNEDEQNQFFDHDVNYLTSPFWSRFKTNTNQRVRYMSTKS